MAFVNNLKTEMIGKRQYTLLDILQYQVDDSTYIVVPIGFTTDFASIKVLHNAFLFVLFALVSGYGDKSATVHDFLYTQASLSRKECDEVLYQALRSEGIAKWRAWMFWVGVRLGGGNSYKTN